MLSWRDTVMTLDEEQALRDKWAKLNPDTRLAFRDYWLEHQAEVSFKAGQEEESTQAYHAGLHDGILRGRKEVMEWIENNAHKQHGEYHIADWEWQAKVKELEVNNDTG